MDYVGKIKYRTTELVHFALHNLGENLKDVYENHPQLEFDELLERVMPSKEDIAITIDAYFNENKYIPKGNKRRVALRAKREKREKKYMEIQLPEQQLCRFNSSEKNFNRPLYIHLSNNMIFIDKDNHYLCIGYFQPSKNQVEWFPEQD